MARTVPYPDFAFKFVDQSGQITGGFSEIMNINTETQVAEYRAGNDPLNHVHKIPTTHKFENFTLKRGIVDSTSFWEWQTAVFTQGVNAKRDVRVVLQNEQNEDVQQFKFIGAFPVSYKGPPMSGAGGTEVAIEEWQIAYDTLEFTQLGTPD
ncbi:MAG: phage tail protein [Pseudomonadota bacterium]